MWRRASSAYVCAGDISPTGIVNAWRPPDRSPDRPACCPRSDARAAEAAEEALADRAVAYDDPRRARGYGQRRVVHHRARRVSPTRVQRDIAEVAQTQRLRHLRGVAALARVDAEPV